MGGAVADPIRGVPPRVEGPDSGVQEFGPLVDKIYFQDTLLTAAQISALAATNIEVVKAPSAGWAAVPIAIHLFLNHGGTDFVQTTGTTDKLTMLYNGGAAIVGEIGADAAFTTFIEASADAVFFVPFGEPLGSATAGGGQVPVAATAIDLDNSGGAEFTTGDGTMAIRVFYRLVPVFEFS